MIISLRWAGPDSPDRASICCIVAGIASSLRQQLLPLSHNLMSMSLAFSECVERMQAHHCTGSDTVVGSANVSSSIFAMLFVGGLIGVAMGTGLTLYLKARRARQTSSKESTQIASPAAPVSACLAVSPHAACTVLYLRSPCLTLRS